jgi:hypothetical protein
MSVRGEIVPSAAKAVPAFMTTYLPKPVPFSRYELSQLFTPYKMLLSEGYGLQAARKLLSNGFGFSCKGMPSVETSSLPRPCSTWNNVNHSSFGLFCSTWNIHVFHRCHLAFTFVPYPVTYLYLLPNAIVGDGPSWPILEFSTIHAQFCTSPVSCSHRLHSILFHYAWVK